MQWEEFRFNVRHLSEADQAVVERAFVLGAASHEGQKRKSGEPYFMHPIAVAHMLADLGGDRDTIVAGLLHDTVEDTPLTINDIEREFGPSVRTLIDGVTKLESVDVADKPGLDQQIETLRKMFTLMQQDVRIMVIKLADRLHNMQTIRFRSPESQVRIARETMDVYVKIADRLCMRDLRDSLEGLCLAILEPELHATLTSLKFANESLTQHVAIDMQYIINSRFPGLASEVGSDSKTWSKLRMQLEIDGSEPTGRGGVNVFIVCEDIDACYATLGALHQTWKREAMTFEDFINAPVINGYKGLHTTVFLQNGTRVRCKIRTREMHEYSHRGVTMHCFDSSSLGVIDELPWTRNVANITEDTQSRSDEFWNSLQSDILQESIVIYGPGGRSALVPRGSTALDGAYFLLRSSANRIKQIRLNGRPVSLSEPVQHAMTLDIELDTPLTVDRQWLHSVQTAFASSMIRTALSKHSREELVGIGQSIVQDTLMERGKWYLEEFGNDLLLRIFQPMGYSSIGDAYVAIAEGRLDSEAVVASIAAGLHTSHKESEKRERVTISFNTRSTTEAHELLKQMSESSGSSIEGIQTRVHAQSTGARATFTGLIHSEQVQLLRRSLITAGARHVTVRGPVLGTVSLMLLVVFFWALNPVIAKWFLLHGLSPIDLLTLRSLSFFVLATIFLGIWSWLRGGLFAPIPRGTRLAFIPAMSSLLLTLCTYMSLSWIPASVHLTILRLNVFLLPLLAIWRGSTSKRVNLLSFITAACGIAAFMVHHTATRVGIAFAFASLASYILYSHISERTMQRGKIGIRYPTFLFQVGWIFGITGIVLLPFMNSALLTGTLLTKTFFYTLFCVFIPHTCFHAVLQRTRFSRITDLSLLEVPLAIAFEIALLNVVLPATEYVVIVGIILSAGLFAFRRFVHTDTLE